MSIETKFTKGIWAIRGDEIGVRDLSDTQSYGMMLSICHMDSWDFKGEWESNAQLIATAPEMFKALSRFYEALLNVDPFSDETNALGNQGVNK
jgi:hypothetical protein